MYKSIVINGYHINKVDVCTVIYISYLIIESLSIMFINVLSDVVYG